MEGNETGYQQDLDLLIKRSRNVPKKASFLKRDLDAKKASEEFRIIFQVPNVEKLDGQVIGLCSLSVRQELSFVYELFPFRWSGGVLSVDSFQEALPQRPPLHQPELCVLPEPRHWPGQPGHSPEAGSMRGEERRAAKI